MDTYRQQVGGAVEAISIDSTTTFSWFGQPSQAPDTRVKRLLSPTAARRFLLARLERQLYQSFYQVGGATSALLFTPSRRGRGDGAFVASLVDANTGAGRWDDGWQVKALPAGGGLTARKADLEVRVASSGFHQRESGVTTIRMPKEYLGLSPGYYMAVGDRDLPVVGADVARLYWNVNAAGAVALMRTITGALNEAGAPFRMKAANDPDAYVRCDSFVVYVLQADLESLLPLFERAWASAAGYMRPRVPALTKALANGLGYASDPANGQSFGQHRSRLIAEGLVLAHEAGLQSLHDRMTSVEQRFTEAGISLDFPYLNQGSPDVSPFVTTVATKRPERAPITTEPESSGYLPAAEAIGRRLCDDAIWHDGRCNWVGSFADGGGTVLRALGLDLYAGASGVGLFLAEMAAATGDKRAGDTAAAALRQALFLDASRPGAGGDSLFLGRTGLALACARAGKLLDDASLIEEAWAILRAATEGFVAGPGSEFDIVSGRAGGVLGLLLLAACLEDVSAIDAARGLAGQLCDAAERSHGGLSWPRTGKPEQNLTGFAHGAAGIAHALVEMYRVTGEPRYGEVAAAAFGYEQRWFDEEMSNWPDFRGIPPRNAASFRLPYFMGWCHGAPGIAISRLRAFEILGDLSYSEQAEQALKATSDAVSTALSGSELSLCHGIAGYATVLGLGAKVLGDVSLSEQVTELAYTRKEGLRPEAYRAPGLMTGAAGVGHFLLRLHDPGIPSPLFLLSDDAW